MSSLHLQAVVPGMYNITVTTYCPLGHTSVSRHLEVRVHGPVGQVQVQYPFGSDRAALHLQAVGTYATSLLLFRGHSFSHSAHFVFDFGDGLPTSYVNGVSHSLGKTASTYHQFTKGKQVIMFANGNKNKNNTLHSPEIRHEDILDTK